MRLRKLLDWRKALIYTHRWAGILLTLVFVIWFVSGIVFVYVGMPTLPAEERLRRMAPLELTNLQITPSEAAARAGLKSPSRVRIAMHDGRPVYRLQAGADWRMVYADTGAPLQGVSADEAMALMRRFVPEHSTTLQYDGRLTDSDQWTLQSIIRNNMPMHRIALGDADGTEYYVSEKTGEPVIRTTAGGRFWGYLSAVLHWLYFTPLRRHAAFWNSFVVWSSLIGTVMCAMGIVIGIWRYSLSGRFRPRRTRSHTPYSNWMKWHHYAGLLFGFFTCTRAFSGALSLGPFDFLKASAPSRAYREAATGGPVDVTPLTVDRIREYDAYYYSQKGQKSLPVLRIRYADPPHTWLYLDPARGVIASRLERASRWNRWLYHGFHSLDFPFMYYKRPIWDLVVILLSLGGIAISVTSALPAWRRLARHVRPMLGRLSPRSSVRLPVVDLGRASQTSRQTAELPDRP